MAYLSGGNALTLVVGLIGILAGVIAYRKGARASHRQNAELRLQLDKMGAQSDQMYQMVKGFVSTGGSELRHAILHESRPPQSPVELLVLSSLGALLNERGDVSLSRLYTEVGKALGASKSDEITEVLQRLRKEGAIEWEGPDDLNHVQTVRVLPRRSANSTDSDREAAR